MDALTLSTVWLHKTKYVARERNFSCLNYIKKSSLRLSREVKSGNEHLVQNSLLLLITRKNYVYLQKQLCYSFMKISHDFDEKLDK